MAAIDPCTQCTCTVVYVLWLACHPDWPCVDGFLSSRFSSVFVFFLLFSFCILPVYVNPFFIFFLLLLFPSFHFSFLVQSFLVPFFLFFWIYLFFLSLSFCLASFLPLFSFFLFFCLPFFFFPSYFSFVPFLLYLFRYLFINPFINLSVVIPSFILAFLISFFLFIHFHHSCLYFFLSLCCLSFIPFNFPSFLSVKH